MTPEDCKQCKNVHSYINLSYTLLTPSQITDIAAQFQFATDGISFRTLHSGHIHDTYLLECGSSRYVLQRVNHLVFKSPETVMENIRKATAFQLEYFRSQQINAVIPELVMTRSGSSFLKDDSGNYWRAFTYIPDTVSFEEVQTPEQAYEAARMFGFFVRSLQDLSAEELQETIPAFHNAFSRRKAFLQAILTGLPDRIKTAATEITFFEARGHIADKIASLLHQKDVPLRIVHNDTKISNVLMAASTGKGVCAIDLDTVMPGTLLYDFGDMMRTFLSPAAEDETDLDKVQIRMDVFESLAKGYWSEVGEWITKAERDNLVFGGMLMTYIMGIRFLTDFLQGDVYYKIYRPTHNLDRSRTQMRLLSLMEIHRGEMEAIISGL
ncbi:aminoglycoside phosphotransferase family protein [Xanthocytophaga agilis]|uniref:Aminoglycoside phosphotransferase family protein n=1 Tax=Xanthocytophaga agilis TaxID=3048010 RepID=A0AAE3UH24_9BACT|nr:aminoglycoside phosphotransferase family protein [Xanthocytophaga agilis]MDJ1502203.1 aminoglycoside phosphotransferase family protein [Xanthocytophaga agilis]